MPQTKEKPTNQSVAKLIHLISGLSESRTPMRLQDIAELTGIPQATCLRYLQALINEGYAFLDSDSGKYSMTWKVCGLADKVRMHRSLRAISGDVVSSISIKLNLGICLVVEHEMECMYLDCIYDSLSIGGTLIRIGKQTPLYASSSGKILLSGFSDREVDYFIEKKGFARLTGKTISTKKQLKSEIQKVRKQGFAVDDEECEEGLRCVAVPIYDYTGEIAAAISAFGALNDLTENRMHKEVIPELKKAAGELSFRMGNGTP